MSLFPELCDAGVCACALDVGLKANVFLDISIVLPIPPSYPLSREQPSPSGKYRLRSAEPAG